MPPAKLQKIIFILTLTLLTTFGDIFDVVSFAGFAALLFFLFKKWQTKNPQAWPPVAQTLVLATLSLCALGALDRVFGYPDREFSQYLIPLAYLVWQIGLLLFLILRKLNGRAFGLALLLIYSPVTELPTLTLRTLAAKLVLRGLSDDLQIDYVSHVGLNEAFAVSVLTLDVPYFKQRGITQTAVVAHFRRHGWTYEFQDEFWLLNGSGTMDRQTPNVPLTLEWLIKYP